MLISFEGGEGSGKTTHAKLLANWMSGRNIPHILTKEPGSDTIKECKKIRKLLLDPNNDLTDRTELFLFLADRAQHVEKLIKPALEDNKHVICDRFIDSTKNYQSARGLDRQKIDLLIDFATNGLKPDVTFILDIPVDVGLLRAKAKSIYKEGDRIEKASLKFHEQVRNNFLKMAESLIEDRFIVVNILDKNINQVHAEIIKYISYKLWGIQQ